MLTQSPGLSPQPYTGRGVIPKALLSLNTQSTLKAGRQEENQQQKSHWLFKETNYYFTLLNSKPLPQPPAFTAESWPLPWPLSLALPYFPQSFSDLLISLSCSSTRPSYILLPLFGGLPNLSCAAPSPGDPYPFFLSWHEGPP